MLAFSWIVQGLSGAGKCLKTDLFFVSPVLILSYKFPPYEGVGARRWVKFVKYFLRRGKKVIVVTNNWKGKGKNSWSHDLASGGNFMVKKYQTPFNALKKKNRYLDKVLNKIEYILSNKFLWTDEAYLFYKLNYKKIRALITEHNIKHVIATGGPFSTNFFAARLKADMPGIYLIQDFRDLWTEEYFFEYPSRTAEHPFYAVEKEMEKLSLQYADLIVSVTPGYLSRLEKMAESLGIHSKHFELIENGFDEDDRMQFSEADFPSQHFKKEDINVSHFGTLGFGREKEFVRFFSSVKDQLRQENGKRIRFHLFGKNPEPMMEEIRKMDPDLSVVFHDFIPPREIQRFMYFSDVHMVVNDKIWYYAFGTKIYDAFLYRKPVLLICEKEHLYQRISSNGLGFATDNDPAANAVLVKSIFDRFERNTHSDPFNTTFDYSAFSVEELAGKFLAHLN